MVHGEPVQGRGTIRRAFQYPIPTDPVEEGEVFVSGLARWILACVYFVGHFEEVEAQYLRLVAVKDCFAGIGRCEGVVDVCYCIFGQG